MRSKISPEEFRFNTKNLIDGVEKYWDTRTSKKPKPYISRDKLKDIQRKTDIEDMYRLVENMTHIEYVDLTKTRAEDNPPPACITREANEGYFAESQQHWVGHALVNNSVMTMILEDKFVNEKRFGKTLLSNAKKNVNKKIVYHKILEINASKN